MAHRDAQRRLMWPRSVFPAGRQNAGLKLSLQKIADQVVLWLRPEWEPLLERSSGGTVLVLEGLFPFKIPPDKAVRKGGYNSVERGDRRHARPDQENLDRAQQAKGAQMSKERETDDKDDDRKALGERLREAREYSASRRTRSPPSSACHGPPCRSWKPG